MNNEMSNPYYDNYVEGMDAYRYAEQRYNWIKGFKDEEEYREGYVY